MATTPASSTDPGQPPGSRLRRVGDSFSKAATSLKIRNFRLLTMGDLFLAYGDWFQFIGLGWLVLEVTGSAVAMAGVTALRGGVSVVISPFGGMLSDRFNRKTIVSWCAGLSSIQAVVLSLLLLTDNLQTWQIYAFAAVEGVNWGIFMPSRQALVYNVVPREALPNAVALSSLTQNVARVTGPVFAGLVISLVGTGWVFVFQAVARVAASVWTMQITGVVEQKATGRAPFFVSLTAGLKYALKNHAVGSLVVVGLIPTLFILPYFYMLPFFAERVLHIGSQGYGILATGVGWGALIGLAAVLFIGNIRKKGWVVFITLLGYALFVGLFSRSTWLPLSMVFLMGAGIVLSIHFATAQTLLQLLTPDEVRGRVFSLQQMGQGLQPLGTFPMAIAVEAWGPADAVSAFVVVAAVVTLGVAALSRELRRTDT